MGWGGGRYLESEWESEAWCGQDNTLTLVLPPL